MRPVGTRRRPRAAAAGALYAAPTAVVSGVGWLGSQAVGMAKGAVRLAKGAAETVLPAPLNTVKQHVKRMGGEAVVGAMVKSGVDPAAAQEVVRQAAEQLQPPDTPAEALAAPSIEVVTERIESNESRPPLSAFNQ